MSVNLHILRRLLTVIVDNVIESADFLRRFHRESS